MTTFDTHVALTPQFQRAIRLDLDWGQDAALRGYICQASSAKTLATMAQHVLTGQQSAFTWTGPYGGGKSSLALVFATALGGEGALRKIARQALGPALTPDVAKAFKLTSGSTSKKWQVVRAVGRRQHAISEICDALHAAEIPRVGKRLGKNPDGARVLKVLKDLSAQEESCGLLLLIDELGKLLEHTASAGADVHFFQELAEVASRSHGRLVVVGILHQAFEQYASRLARESRDEWAKVQGRFSDIPVIGAIDETLELTARAINAQKRPSSARTNAQVVATAIGRNRAGLSKHLPETLEKCWPLHPATAALLGAVSRRRFGQNERSTFAFLSSSEAFGFAHFLRSVDDDGFASYTPQRYWDYLRTNLEPAILVSPDGHRWAQAADAVSRCEGHGDLLCVQLMKAIAVLDLFRNESGLVPSKTVLSHCVPGQSSGDIEKALNDLVGWSVAVYRKHLDAYAVFEGSDFDIDAAVGQVIQRSSALDASRLARLAPLQPILPKRHYHDTGALRWFELQLCSEEALLDLVDAFKPGLGVAGRFILVIARDATSPRRFRALCKDASSRRADFPVVIGCVPNSSLLITLGRELSALESLQQTRAELGSDRVARKELQARIAAVSARLEDELIRARDMADWYCMGDLKRFVGPQELHAFASDLCEATFNKAPAVRSELLNRPTISSNAQAAVNALLAAMVANPTQFAFGIEGYPPERGLYESVFRATGLHVGVEQDVCQFVRPTKKTASSDFVALWTAADALLSKSSDIVPLTRLYAIWAAPPFGVNAGLMGLLSLAYLLSNRKEIAAYQDGMYQPEVHAVFAHEVVRDPTVIGFRRLVAQDDQSRLLKRLSTVISRSLQVSCAPEALAVGRQLVKFVFGLPHWTRRTSSLSEAALRFRTTLLAASDPHKLALVDFPGHAAEANFASMDEYLSAMLTELAGAYPGLLHDLSQRFFRALGAGTSSLETIRMRAKTVHGLTGDLQIDALAVQLLQYDGGPLSFESVVSLAAQKPPKDWTDLDVSAATLAMAELALRFRRAEVLAAVQNRVPSRTAIGLVVGTGEQGTSAMRALDIGSDEKARVQSMAEELLSVMTRSGYSSRLALAALAHASVELIEHDTSLAESE